MRLAPILLFVYKRYDLTLQTLNALTKNYLADNSDLIIISDAPKTEDDLIKVKKVRKLIKDVKGFKSLEIIERESNLGLSGAIINGVTDIINMFGKVIVLEDDLLTGKFFLKYMNDGLNTFHYFDEVISIHGFVYPIKSKLPETFFIKGADCWGWATWKRGWDLFENDASKLLDMIDSENLKEEFNFGGSANYYKMLGDQVKNKIDSWAIRWYASAFLADKLTLYPGKTLVNNIGFASEATHTRTKLNYNSPLYQDQIKVEKIAIEENKLVREQFVNYFKEMKGGIVKKITDYLRSKMLVR